MSASPGAPSQSPDVVLEGHFGDADRMRYSLVPFEVPPGCRQMQVRYAYSDRIDSDPLVSGGNTLDIGLFDSRGTETGRIGFSGWSGSNKVEFVVGEDWATPPYAAGPMPPGRWHILLGPYKVGPRGCDWRVEVRLDPGLPPFERDLVRSGSPVRPTLPAARDGWVRGDLHCHTRYSDGDSWPSEMLHAAVESGLDFLGVTDHNNVAHHAEYGPGGGFMPIVIPGVEVTTYGGHWNAWGTDRWWEFREPTAPAVERAMADAAEAGAFVSVNHPKPFGPPWEYETVGSAHAIEIWNGSWERLNSSAQSFWDDQLKLGRRLVAVGGSDTHVLRSRDPDSRHAEALSMPTTWVAAGPNPDAAAILRGLRAGHTFVSASPAGPQIYLDPDGDDVEISVRDAPHAELIVLGSNGPIATEASRPGAWSTRTEVPHRTTYVRAQLSDASGNILALTSPLWLD